SVVTQTPKNLVYPLINSLKHEMTPSPSHLLKIDEHPPLNFEQSIEKSLHEDDLRYAKGHKVKRKKLQFWGQKIKKKDVRSIQRLERPANKSASWVAKEYIKWLPQFFKFIKLIKVRFPREGVTQFIIPILNIPILELTFSNERSSEDRQLFYITGGLLAAKEQGRGRLEFRETTCGKYFIVAIHEFVPAVPWYVYIYTQAPFHLFVMKRFQKFIKKISY
ncbi:MAG: hypothetical protein OEY33_08775, partial [Bdellovibrionales bacterium]|nr:hypothetical protein [Bdellovibrionales bacterium]